MNNQWKERFANELGFIVKPGPTDSFRHHEEYEREQAIISIFETEIAKAKQESYTEGYLDGSKQSHLKSKFLKDKTNE